MVREEEDLLACEASRGNRAAFCKLFKISHGWLFRFALARTGDRPDADDVVQEVFLGLWPVIGTFRGFGFRAWVREIARNVTAERVRGSPAAKARRAAERNAGRSELDPADVAEFVREVVESWNRLKGTESDRLSDGLDEERLRKTLSSFPDGQRKEAIVGFHFEGLSCKELAQRSGRSLAAIKKDLERGRDDLRRALKRRDR
jgi:RNA polymerase sigma-70 factor (ECF subfamily)